MSTEDYALLPATPSDIPAMAILWSDAFAADPIVSNLEADVEPELRRTEGERWHRSQMEHAHLYGSRWTKVVERNSGKLVGFCKWNEPVTLDESQRAEKAAFEAAEDARPFVKGANASLCRDFFTQLREKRQKWSDPEKDYYLNLLAVSPAHHRRGLGSLLMRECLKCADEDGARTYIEASAIGRPLYLRHGWEWVDDIVLDLDAHKAARFGGKHVEACLMRMPKGKGVGDR